MMLVTYDVDTTTAEGARRLRQVAKTCEAYGNRVQNSVFELVIEPAQLVRLKSDLEQIIDSARDSVRLYQLGSHGQRRIETMGRTPKIVPDEPLIL